MRAGAAPLIAALLTCGTAFAVPNAPAAAPGASAPALHGPLASKKKPAPHAVTRIDLNTASRAKLKTLPGVDDAAAARLIAGRPYLTKTELVSKGIMPIGPYLAIKDQVTALHKARP